MYDPFEALADLIAINQPVTVLTGAGISKASGLPVYRDAAGNWVHSKPIQGPEFIKNPAVRQRYWCRSFFGWPLFSQSRPNNTHRDIAVLHRLGIVSTIITQNVDSLHQLAGSTDTIALHGRLAEVICLECKRISSRDKLQLRLEQINPHLNLADIKTAPDGDAIVDQQLIDQFNTASCEQCGGALKPNVVFFGDTVPIARVDTCMQQLSSSGMLLCIGTSLTVYSGFRFCKAATRDNLPIAIINQGVTRADDIATIKVDNDCVQSLEKLRHWFEYTD